MRILRWGLTLSFLAIPSALAESSLPVLAIVDVDCAINSGPSLAVDLTGTTVNQYRSVQFTYHCNLEGPITFEASSSNGGVKLTNSSVKSNYGIFIRDIATPIGVPAQWTKALAAFNNFQIITGVSSPPSPSTPRTTNVFVGLVEPLSFAGQYEDTLTIRIAP